MDEQTINIPQLLIVLVLGGLAVRYLFFSPSANGTVQGGRSSRGRVREQDVQQLEQMFPQMSRRHIMWDLQRNGGNIAATTERILSGRGLDTVSHWSSSS
jgi:coupling of ubiquitin conjugation to ER degradation protein 1